MSKIYDKHRKEIKNVFSKLLNIIINHKFSDNLNILDIGCGSGRYSINLIKRLNKIFSNKVNLTGIDLTPKMIKIAKANYPKGVWICRDVLKTKLKPNTFDIVSAIHSLHLIGGSNKLFLKIKKALKKNGLFIILMVPPGKNSIIFHRFIKILLEKDKKRFTKVNDLIKTLKALGFKVSIQKANYYLPIIKTKNDVDKIIQKGKEMPFSILKEIPKEKLFNELEKMRKKMYKIIKMRPIRHKQIQFIIIAQKI